MKKIIAEKEASAWNELMRTETLFADERMSSRARECISHNRTEWAVWNEIKTIGGI